MDRVEPLPKPEPNDWLANHAEPGQTFEQFVDSHPNRPDKQRHTIYIQPLGNLAVAPLRRFASDFFGMRVEALPPIDIAAEPVTTRRNPQLQLLTADILTLLKRRLPRDAFCLIGVSMTDLYPDPTWNFVFGQASLRERVAVVSFARYADPDPDLVFRRSCKVLAHETCHMFGIAHCIFYRCLMNGSNHLAESDGRPMRLCPIDRKKLQWSLGRLRSDERHAPAPDSSR